MPELSMAQLDALWGLSILVNAILFILLTLLGPATHPSKFFTIMVWTVPIVWTGDSVALIILSLFAKQTPWVLLTMNVIFLLFVLFMVSALRQELGDRQNR